MLLTDESDIRDVVQRLEVHYLGNPDPELRFALLSDWSDAPSESLPEDQALLDVARAAIRELNEEHGSAAGGGDRFWVFHRRRLWNPSEGAWMGWERKRGKLRELNRLLRGATDTSFLPQDHGAAPPSGVRYVVTLDADTRLPREAVRRMVGTISHPLNLPIFDAAAGRVVDGHAILQPRVTPTLAETGWGTIFQLVFSGPRGIDPYAFAVSDVYQDLFGEGIYTGKGIYEVDVFERALGERVPENTQLSHDLFEGLFARAGFASDVELFEGFPGHYEVAASRQHRWVRGDWQLLPWILGTRPHGRPCGRLHPHHGAVENARQPPPQPLGARDARDPARRVVPAEGEPEALDALRARRFSRLPTLLSFFTNLVPNRRGIAKRSFVRGVVADLAVGLAQSALRVVFLAHTAWLRTGRDRADTLAGGGDAAPAAGVGARRRSRCATLDLEAYGFLPSHALGPRGRRGGGASWSPRPGKGLLAMGRALPGLLARLAAGCLVGQPAAAGDRRRPDRRGPGARSCA